MGVMYKIVASNADLEVDGYNLNLLIISVLEMLHHPFF